MPGEPTKVQEWAVLATKTYLEPVTPNIKVGETVKLGLFKFMITSDADGHITNICSVGNDENDKPICMFTLDGLGYLYVAVKEVRR